MRASGFLLAMSMKDNAMWTCPAARSAVGLAVIVAGVAAAHGATAACAKQSWPAFERKIVAAQVAFQAKDPAPFMQLWSHEPDISLFGANGGHEIGWSLVGPRIARISASNTGGPREDQVLVRTVGTDLAVIVQQENTTVLKPGSPPVVDHLRVTHIARCEGSEWRIIHRHADRLVEPVRGLQQ
jgi:hypothetical protein